MHSAAEIEPANPAGQTPRSSKAALRLGVLAGLITGEAYSIYATFVAHALIPASVYIVDRSTHRRLPPGQIGDLMEVFHWDGLLAILLLSFAVFVSTCWIVCACARSAQQPGRKPVGEFRRSPAFVNHSLMGPQRLHR